MAAVAPPSPLLALLAAAAALLLLAGGARTGLRGSASPSGSDAVHSSGGPPSGRRLLALSSFRDPKSTSPRARKAVALSPPSATGESARAPSVRIAGYRRSGWPGREGYYSIELISPKPGHVYSVTINSPGRYTGTATLLTKPPTLKELEEGAAMPEVLQYGWEPAWPLEDYRIEVHELAPGWCCSQGRNTLTKSIGSPLPFAVSPEKLGGEAGVERTIQRFNDAPRCQDLPNIDAYSTWDGTWIGPQFRRGAPLLPNALRTGWSFHPSTRMGGGCRIESFSREELLSIPPKPDGRPTHIYVVGTSVMRGVYHSIMDLVLPQADKRSFFASMLYKCWGRSDLKKGNLRLTYQDLRITEMEPPDEAGADLVECHNDQVVKEGMSFLRDSYRFWEELWEDSSQWPDVVFFGSGYRWADNHHFETHTLWFAKNLPSEWKGTIIFSGGMFHGGLGHQSVVDYERYQTEIRQMLAAMDDPRVRWLDGMGVSKDHRLYTEAGPKHISGSAHFHSSRRKEPVYEPHGEIAYQMGRKDMQTVSNVTDVLGALLLGHALGPKRQFLERIKEADSHMVGAKSELEMCTACPESFKPFRIVPYPELKCSKGPIPKRGSDGFVNPTKECPEHCLREEPEYSFPSQSDTVYVRKCPSRPQQQ